MAKKPAKPKSGKSRGQAVKKQPARVLLGPAVVEELMRHTAVGQSFTYVDEERRYYTVRRTAKRFTITQIGESKVPSGIVYDGRP